MIKKEIVPGISLGYTPFSKAAQKGWRKEDLLLDFRGDVVTEENQEDWALSRRFLAAAGIYGAGAPRVRVLFELADPACKQE